MEESVLVEDLRIRRITAEIARHDGRPLQHHFALVADLYFYAFNRTAYRPDGIRLAQMVAADRGQTFRQTVADDHVQSDAVYEFLDLR